MDTARDKQTKEPVEAESLWDMTIVDSDGYICRGCSTQVFPASYDKERNRKRPYFSLGPKKKHESGCNVDGEEKIVQQAKKGRVGKPEGFPLPFPSRLTLSDDRTIAPDDAGQLSGQTRVSSESRATNGVATNRHHGHTVKTIRPACRAFIKFPHDREYLPLAIPDVLGDTYSKIFRYLGSKKPEYFKEPNRLYYAAIRWKAEPVVTETLCELTLNAGEWDQEKREYKSLLRVRVDWSKWSQSRRDSLIREFGATREEAAQQSKTDSQIKGWIFFVGAQDIVDPGIFHVDNYRLICCLAAKMLWPSKK